MAGVRVVLGDHLDSRSCHSCESINDARMRWIAVAAGGGLASVSISGSSQGSVQLWPVPWLISQALSSTYVAGEHRLYLERNCRPSESPAHGTRRKSRGACQCQGAEQSARVRPSGKTSAKVQAAFHECSWFVAL